jgi:hypothetical protein
MAKKSSINKNERRKAMVKQYAGKFAALKALANDESLDDAERLMAPEDGNTAAQREPDPGPQPLHGDRSFARCLSQIQTEPDHDPRIGQQGPDSRSDQVQLVREGKSCR